MIRNIFKKIKKVFTREKPTERKRVTPTYIPPPSKASIEKASSQKPHRYGRIKMNQTSGKRFRHTDPRKVKPTQRPLFPVNDIRDTT